jgi:hypothetical protein
LKIILTSVALPDFLGIAMVNGFATAAPVNKKAKGELVEKYPIVFVPDCNMKPC